MIHSNKSNIPTFLYLILVLLIGILIYLPQLDFQAGISQGDHGRDLYAFKTTLEGGRPYHDYWWPYGPLMPYYYSLFFKLFGISMQSAVLGKVAFILFSGIFFFLALRLFIKPTVAIVGTIWFLLLNPKFTHTYNHIGAISLFMPTIYFLFLYIKTERIKCLYWAQLFILLIALIKLNIGFATLLAFNISVFLIEKTNDRPLSSDKVRFFAASLCLLPLCILGIYFLFIFGLSLDYINQCFPFRNKYNVVYNSSIWIKLNKYFSFIGSTLTSNNFQHIKYKVPFIVTVFTVIETFRLFIKNKFDEKQKKLILTVSGILLIFSLLNYHEFLMAGQYYKSFWARPFEILLLFFLIGMLVRGKSWIYQFIIIISICAFCYFMHWGRNNWRHTMKTYSYEKYFSFQGRKFYSTNSPAWFRTIKDAAAYLDNKLNQNETFLAIPYEPLYFFLMGKKSPTKLICIFEFTNISDKQQKEIIQTLEEKNINYILMSNRVVSNEPDYGIFGKTHAQMLYQFILENYEEVAAFGDWGGDAGYMWNHATRIYKRRLKR